MLQGLLLLLIVAAGAVMMLSLLRRSPRAPERAATPGRSAARGALPPSADATTFGEDDVLRKLYGLALAADLHDSVAVEHAKIVAAIAATLPSAAAEPRYAPRRPMLLPQLLRALGDEQTSRRELADIIARDPTLVGSLLKLANSPYYRTSSRKVESIESAVAAMGTQGIRALIAAALVQPVFRAGAHASDRFPEVVWEHAYCSAAAAETHAAEVGGADPFSAQLLALVTGLGAIVIFRVAQDHYAARAPLRADATAIAALLEAHTPVVARHIAVSWELSERLVEALEEPLPGKPVSTAASLRRSLRFGLHAGALIVLKTHHAIEEPVGRAALARAGGTGPRVERLWERFTHAADE